jgi:hypothetical protein
MLANVVRNTDANIAEKERLALRQKSIDLAQNEFVQLPDAEQTKQRAGAIGGKYGVGAEEVLKGAKDPNRPLVEVSTYDRKQGVNEASKLINVSEAISELGEVRKMVVSEDGSINRGVMLAAALELPFTKGRTVSQFIKKSIEIKLRANTGAEAKDKEIKLYDKMFGPSVKDSDELIRYKIDSFELWMQAVADTTDPEGALRRRANELINEGTFSQLNSPEYKFLRKKFPQASSAQIMVFIKSKQDKKD